MKLLLPSVLVIFISAHIFGQKVDFEFDYAQFGFDSTANYVEFYYSFNQTSFVPAETDSGTFLQGILHIAISDSATGNEIVNNNWLMSNPALDSTETNKSLIGLLGFVLAEGAYKCEISGTDINSPGSEKVITEFINIHPFMSIATSLSDIQIASNIIQDSENKTSIFYKNTYEVMPIPKAIFGENQPVLFYYSELYNLKNGGNEDNYRLDQLVFNSRGQLVSSKSKRINKQVDSRVEVGRVMTYKLPTDTYTLVLNLIDSVANFGVSSSKRFFVYNPSIAYTDTFTQKVTPVLSTMFGAMSEEELDDLFLKSRYIANESEIKQYASITTLEGKREYMYNFWNARDDNPSDDNNRYFLDYLNRIEESNSRYSAISKEGWKTDRGRVFIMYGEPSEIERYPNQVETRPYEIWHFDSLEGGVVFIFADLTGFSNYQLVHSTKRGELRDDYWMRRVQVR